MLLLLLLMTQMMMMMIQMISWSLITKLYRHLFARKDRRALATAETRKLQMYVVLNA